MKSAGGARIVAAIYLGYAATLAFFLLPVLWIVSLSLRPLDELFAYPPRLLPAHVDWSSYQTVLLQSPLPLYVWNSVKFAAATMVGALVVAVPAAYALSRLRFRGAVTKQGILLGILAVQLVSPLVTALPLYRYFSALGLINSQLAVSLVYIAIEAPFATWMLKGFFDTVPQELDEAARIDGCSRLQTLWRVVMPVMLPGLASTAIVLAISSWGQFLIPYILIDNNDLQPIGVGILDFQSTAQAVSTNQLAAAAVLAAIPAVVIFTVLQRFIVSGLTSGALKG